MYGVVRTSVMVMLVWASTSPMSVLSHGVAQHNHMRAAVPQVATQTRPLTYTRTATRTRPPTYTRTATRTATATATPSRSRTATRTRTASMTRSRTATVTASRTRSATATRTLTRSMTSSVTPSLTQMPTATATRMGGTVVPADMMGLVGRDPYFEFVDNRVNMVAQERMGFEMARLGVRWVRLDIRLPVGYTTSSAAITAAISRYDFFITDVAPRYGIKVLLLLNFDLIMGVDANELMRGPYANDLQYGPGYNVYMRAWMQRAWQIVMRYGRSIGAIEILNEANRLPRYTSNGPLGNAVPAAVFAQLTATLYQACNGGALQSACAGTPIILGGLHPRGTNAQGTTPAQSDMAYLRDIYNSAAFTTAYATLGRWPLDAVGYHPYPVELAYIGVRTQHAALDRLRATLQALNDGLRPVWITEIGYNVAYANQTAPGQALFLGAIYRAYASRLLADGTPEIPVAFWFKYEDFPPASGINAQQWGLVHIPFVPGSCPGEACYAADGAPTHYRPAWYVYRDIHP